MAVIIPHNIYPKSIKGFLLPIFKRVRSLKTPIKIVVRVAVIAETATIHAIMVGSVVISSNTKTLNHVFSIAHAISPTIARVTIVNHVWRDNLVTFFSFNASLSIVSSGFFSMFIQLLYFLLSVIKKN